MNKTYLSVFLSFITIAALLPLAWSAYTTSGKYEAALKELSVKMEAKAKLQFKVDKWLSAVTLGVHKSYEKSVAELQKLRKNIETFKQNALDYTLYFFLGIVAYLFLFMLLVGMHSSVIIISLVAISVMSLLVGLFAPILTVSFNKELPYVGEVILQHQSKTIYDTIQTLLTNENNMVVGILLLVFSVIFPIVKLFTTFMSSLSKFWRENKIFHMLHNIGKWSMADVFVIAIFIVFLNMEQTETSNANLHIGFYFFAMYVLTSMFASHVVQKQTTLLSNSHVK